MPKGRPLGSKGKASKSAKENVLAVFHRLGSTAAMAKWAQENQTEFYKMYARLIPQQIDMDVRQKPCDVSAEPLKPDEWDQKYGEQHLTQ
jgi:predicted sulfurtransferase